LPLNEADAKEIRHEKNEEDARDYKLVKKRMAAVRFGFHARGLTVIWEEMY
jgi:hypothetical protein